MRCCRRLVCIGLSLPVVPLPACVGSDSCVVVSGPPIATTARDHRTSCISTPSFFPGHDEPSHTVIPPAMHFVSGVLDPRHTGNDAAGTCSLRIVRSTHASTSRVPSVGVPGSRQVKGANMSRHTVLFGTYTVTAAEPKSVFQRVLSPESRTVASGAADGFDVGVNTS